MQGGTAATQEVFIDHMGIPTLAAIRPAVQALQNLGMHRKVQLIVNLASIAAERGIKYFLISFTDLFGGQRSKLVPAAAIGGIMKTGAGFAGFATWLQLTPADPDMFAVPDPDSLIQLPWRLEVSWLAADPVMNGKPVEHGPRNVLKRQIAAAAELGYQMKTGVECEFFLLSADGEALSDASDKQIKPCYDQ